LTVIFPISQDHSLCSGVLRSSDPEIPCSLSIFSPTCCHTIRRTWEILQDPALDMQVCVTH